MKKEEYYKAAYDWLQLNKKNKGVRPGLTPGTKKVDIQFFKKKNINLRILQGLLQLNDIISNSFCTCNHLSKTNSFASFF
jgi:hypothetical protein